MASVEQMRECGFCCKTFASMHDPRELPCRHIFCLLCLQEYYAYHEKIRCKPCRKVYWMKEFDHLPSACDESLVVGEEESSRVCENIGCDGRPAECYCVECAQTLCSSHKQDHASYFDNHKVISMSDYEHCPGDYKTVCCQQHGESITEVCISCNAQACESCDKASTGCAENNRHEFLSLAKVKADLTDYFKPILSSANNKLTEICQTDKAVWNSLETEEEACEKRIAMVDKIRDAKISAIIEESEELKRQIDDRRKELIKLTESRYSLLTAAREQLDESCLQIHKCLRERHVTENLREKHKMTNELTEKMAVELKHEFPKAPVLTAADARVHLIGRVVAPPTSIEFKLEQKTEGSCYSASYKDDGDLLLGCEDGVRLLRQRNNEMIRLDTFDTEVTSIVHQNRNVLVLHGADLDMCMPAMNHAENLFIFQELNNTTPFCAVSDQLVVVSNPDDGTLVLYDFKAKKEIILDPEVDPWAVYFLPEGDLLVTSLHAPESLTRYKLVNHELVRVWICEGLENAYSVTADSDGIIYVCTTSASRTLYFVSSHGELLGKIVNDKLPEFPGQMSIKDNGELAVPSWSNKSVCLFEILH